MICGAPRYPSPIYPSRSRTKKGSNFSGRGGISFFAVKKGLKKYRLFSNIDIRIGMKDFVRFHEFFQEILNGIQILEIDLFLNIPLYV